MFFLILFIHFFVFSLASIETSPFLNTIPSTLEQSIVQDISSCDTFPVLSSQEKQLFLHALLFKFTDSALDMIEIITKAKLFLTLQAKKGESQNIEQIDNLAMRIPKISLLQDKAHTAKKICFAYLKQHHEPVIKALDHVKSNGRALSTELTIAFVDSIDACSKELLTTIASTIEHLSNLHQKIIMPTHDDSHDAIPSSIMKLDTTVTISQLLESSCHDMQKASLLYLPILTSIIEPCLHLLNVYYKTVYQQLYSEYGNKEFNTAKEYFQLFASPTTLIPLQDLPNDLAFFFKSFVTQYDNQKVEI